MPRAEKKQVPEIILTGETMEEMISKLTSEAVKGVISEAMAEASGTYRINDAYRPIAEKLVAKFPELRHIPVKAILFIDSEEGSGKSRDKVIAAKTFKIPERYQEIIRQLSGRLYQYGIEFYKKNMSEYSREQIVMLVYHELRHIGRDGNLVHHAIEEWGEVYHGVGGDWAGLHRAIPDLLDDMIDWSTIRTPSLFDEGRPLRAVK